MKRASAVLLAVGLAGAAWLWWQRRPPPLAGGACRGCNVLLVTIDTLRLDRVGAFGSQLGLTPNLDRLAAEGFRLTRAYVGAADASSPRVDPDGDAAAGARPPHQRPLPSRPIGADAQRRS